MKMITTWAIKAIATHLFSKRKNSESGGNATLPQQAFRPVAKSIVAVYVFVLIYSSFATYQCKRFIDIDDYEQCVIVTSDSVGSVLEGVFND
jgi:hypothetical protein